MTLIRRVFVALASLVLTTAPAFAFQPSAGQGEFVPVGELPAGEQLPVAPLLIGAYAFVWVALILYLWSIWRRLDKVEADIEMLGRRVSPERGTR
jgi:hypothetical protein